MTYRDRGSVHFVQSLRNLSFRLFFRSFVHLLFIYSDPKYTTPSMGSKGTKENPAYAMTRITQMEYIKEVGRGT